MDGQQRAKWLPVAALAILATAGLGLAWYFRSGQASPAPAPVAAPAPTATPHPAMPSTADADAQARAQVAGLSSSPLWARWLQESDLVRRFVSSVDMAARGDSPARQVPFLAPRGRFPTEERGGKIFLSTKGFERYDAVVDVLTTVDVGPAATAYTALHPLLDAAYAEIGKPGTTLDGRLSEAIHRVTTTKMPDGTIELAEAGVNYKYADASLEALPAASRQLIRMGPRNLKLLQEKLQSLADALRLPPPAEG